MKIIAKIISGIFSPLLIPTYGMIIALFGTSLVLVPAGIRINVTLITFAITCLVPTGAFYVLYRLGLISDFGLNSRRERTVPYIIVSLSYLAATFCMIKANAPDWMRLFMVGGLAAAIISGVINVKWKISGHSAATAGLIALCFRIMVSDQIIGGLDMKWITMAAILCWGLTGSARLILERHTLGQVLAGAANGFLCVYFIMGLH